MFPLLVSLEIAEELGDCLSGPSMLVTIHFSYYLVLPGDLWVLHLPCQDQPILGHCWHWIGRHKEDSQGQGCGQGPSWKESLG